MKKQTRYFILLAVLLVVGGVIGWLAKDGMRPSPQPNLLDSVRIPVIVPSPLLDSLRQQATRDRQTEMDYYLDRHNVEDEGYEMVAAFAAGKRHQEEIDTISIYNVGRWKGKKREGTAISRDTLGRITIGHHSTIGGNIWLTHDVLPYSRILQSKAVDVGFQDGAGI